MYLLGLPVWAASGVALIWASPWSTAATFASAAATAGFTELLIAALSLVGAVLHAWLSVGAVLAVVAAGRSGGAQVVAQATRYLVPGWWRRAVVSALGTAVAAVNLAGPAGAEITAAPVAGRPAAETGLATLTAQDDRQPSARLDGLPYPDRPAAGCGSQEPVVVRLGDSLWGIAAAQLGRRADAAATAAAWPAWYRANRRAVGPDADHILPGTVLWPPHIPLPWRQR